MEWVETTGRTIDEAKDSALDELGVDDSEAEFEIVEEPKAGLFGRVRREARVRARVRPVAVRPKADRRKARPSRKSRSGRQDQSQSSDSPPVKKQAAKKQAAKNRPAKRSDAGEQDASGTDGGPSPAKRKQKVASASDSKERNSAKMETIELNQQVEVVEDFLHGLVEAFGVEAQVSSETVDEDVVEVRVEGDDLGLLVGPKGRTLAALQELSRTVTQRQLVGTHQGRVRIDVAGYRERRRAALSQFTRQVAEDVKASGVQKVLEAMSPADRKVVHDTVNEIDGVHSSSEGEDPNRRAVILPN